MSKRWFYMPESSMGEKQGPVTDKELKALADRGLLLPGDLIWREGMNEWKPAKMIKGLFAEPHPSAPPLTPKIASPRLQTAPRTRTVPVWAVALGLVVVMTVISLVCWPFPADNPYVEDPGIRVSAVPLEPDGTAYQPLRYVQLGLGWVMVGLAVGLVALLTKPRDPSRGRPGRRMSPGVAVFAALLVAFMAATLYAVAFHDPYYRTMRKVVPVWRLSLSSPLKSLPLRSLAEWKDPSARPFILDPYLDPSSDPRVLRINDIDLAIPNSMVDHHYSRPILRVIAEPRDQQKTLEIKLVDCYPVSWCDVVPREDDSVHSYYDVGRRTDYMLVKKNVAHYDGSGLIRTTTHLIPDAVASDGTSYTLYFTKGVLEAVSGGGVTFVLPSAADTRRKSRAGTRRHPRGAEVVF